MGVPVQFSLSTLGCGACSVLGSVAPVQFSLWCVIEVAQVELFKKEIQKTTRRTPKTFFFSRTKKTTPVSFSTKVKFSASFLRFFLLRKLEKEKNVETPFATQ
jgi:hypothetical protein